MSIRRRVGALEELTKGREQKQAGPVPNSYEPGNPEQLCDYDPVTDVVNFLPAGTPRGYSVMFNWKDLRRFLCPPGRVLPTEPTIRRLGEEGADGEGD